MQTHGSGSSCGGPMAEQYQEPGLRIVMGKLCRQSSDASDACDDVSCSDFVADATSLQ